MTQCTTNVYWKEPTVVSGKNGQQVLVKHSPIYFCCHPCRLAFGHNTRYQEKKWKNQTLSETEKSESITEDDNEIDELRKTY